MQSQEIFDRVLALAGLSALVGRGVIHRALRDVGANPETASLNDYRRALSRLDARLRAYLSDADATERMARIGQFLRDGRVASDAPEGRSGPGGPGRPGR